MGQFTRNTFSLLTHGMPVSNRFSNIRQNTPCCINYWFEVIRYKIPLNFDTHPGLNQSASGSLVNVNIEHLQELSFFIPANGKLWMDDEVHVASVVHQVGRHRVDQERHVVCHDFDHCVVNARNIRGPAAHQSLTRFASGSPLLHLFNVGNHRGDVAP